MQLLLFFLYQWVLTRPISLPCTRRIPIAVGLFANFVFILNENYIMKDVKLYRVSAIVTCSSRSDVLRNVRCSELVLNPLKHNELLIIVFTPL